MKDQRYVYGATCTWHGPIQEVASTARGSNVDIAGGDGQVRSFKLVSGLPCCPHCGGLLMEYPTSMEWRASASKFCSVNSFTYDSYMKWLESLRVDEKGSPVHCETLQGWDWRKSYGSFCEARGLKQ